MKAHGRRIALTEHIDIEWLAGQTGHAVCPNCGVQGEVAQILDIQFVPPDPHEDEHHFIMQVCPACTVRFVHNTVTMDYSTKRLVQLGWDSYQVQLGAGIWPITAQLAAVDLPRGAKLLEIGGAFGFGLDFCIRARGWDGVGYDPSPLAAFGIKELGLPLRQEYFTVRHLGLGPWDAASATELIEHVSYPVAFLIIMRRALGETGVLVLSTPDAAYIAPETPDEILLPLLSPGAHTVLQTKQSLEAAMREAGFTHISIVEDGMSLVAYASAAPFTLLQDKAARRAMYRNYLVERAKETPLMSDLRLGFAGRGIFEAANDGDWAAADTAWEALLPAVQARFGLDLAAMTALPPDAADTSLAALVQLMPLGLGMIMFGRAMRLLQAGQSRLQVEPVLRLAAAATASLLTALAKRTLIDGLSVSIAALLKTELLLCAAAGGREEAVAGLVALGDEATSWRGFIEMVNAGELAAAAALKAALPALPGAGVPAGLRRNALLSLANFHLAPEGDTLQAFASAEALRAIGEPADMVLLGGFVRLVNAGRHEAARAAAEKYGVLALAQLHAGQEAGRDAAVALALLALAAGDPLALPGMLADLPLGQADQEALLLEAFVRLVNAERLQEALAFSAAHDVPGLCGRVDAPAARNARLARATLTLNLGDPAAIPDQLAGWALAPAQREALLLQAFTRLALAARYAEAQGFAAAYDVPAMQRRATGEIAVEAAIGLAVLALAAGDPALVPGILQGTEIAPARYEGLVLQAFTRLANAARHADARAFAGKHDVPAMLARQGGEIAADAAAALALLELADGDPALVPALLAGHPVPPAQRVALLLSAFTGLVNAGRYAAAEAMRDDHPALQDLDAQSGDAAADARWAELMLDLQNGRPLLAARKAAAREAGGSEAGGGEAGGSDAGRLAAIYAGAFVRLVNQGDFAAARELEAAGGLERRMELCSEPARLDALTCLLLLDLQIGADAAERVPARLQALQRANMDEARLREFGFQAFSMLVNQAGFGPARKVLSLVEADLLKLRPPFSALARDALFAAGILFLQQKEDWRRSAASFARLRDGLLKQTPPGQAADPLFWPALRGEIVALNQLNRGDESATLLRSFLDAYPDAPDDLREQLKGGKR